MCKSDYNEFKSYPELKQMKYESGSAESKFVMNLEWNKGVWSVAYSYRPR